MGALHHQSRGRASSPSAKSASINARKSRNLRGEDSITEDDKPRRIYKQPKPKVYPNRDNTKWQNTLQGGLSFAMSATEYKEVSVYCY